SKKAVLRRELEPGVAIVEGDATQLRQIVMNLITNASEALDDDPGVITIAASVIEADREYLLTTYIDDDLQPGRYVALEVSDTGHGMDEDTKSRMFDPFFSTKRTGRGLGMAAVLGIVRGHGGAIKVYSERGRGTCVKVLLPCVEPSVPSAMNGTSDTSAPGSEVLSGTILVADDEEAVRQVTRLALEMAGFTVITAADGEEAVECFAAHASEVRAILLDLSMPKMSGDEAFAAIKRIRPDVPVILSSGFNEQDTTNRLAGRGLAGFIQKPYRPTELIEKLRQLLRGA
ncbi:MAG TPA: response regulator, partial [Armatimonadota bacterium]|nr:response regulator [Armatimonadota bacterium]